MPLSVNIVTWWHTFSWYYNMDKTEYFFFKFLFQLGTFIGCRTENTEYQNCKLYIPVMLMMQTQVLDYTVRGAVRAAVSPCVSTAGLHCKDVSWRRDTSSTEVRGPVSCTDPLTASGSLFFLTSTVFVSLYPLSLEASDREALDFFSFFLWGSCTMLWRWRLCFMVNFLPQPTWVQT